MAATSGRRNVPNFHEGKAIGSRVKVAKNALWSISRRCVQRKLFREQNVLILQQHILRPRRPLETFSGGGLRHPEDFFACVLFFSLERACGAWLPQDVSQRKKKQPI